MASEPTPLLEIRLNGELVAEAQLVVHDGAGAWYAFCESFPSLANEILGEVFNTVRCACDPELNDSVGPQGILIDLQTGSRGVPRFKVV